LLDVKGKAKDEQFIDKSDKSEYKTRTYAIHCTHFGFTGDIFTAEGRPHYLVWQKILFVGSMRPVRLKCLQNQYQDLHRIAQCEKPHITRESLLLPAANVRVINTKVLGGLGAKQLRRIPFSPADLQI
jgi:hypothetical protein